MRSLSLFASRRVRTLGVVSAAIALMVAGSGSAFAGRDHHHRAHHVTVCRGGELSGTVRNLVVTGACTVPANGTLLVNGGMTVTGSNAVFLSEFSAGSHVLINGDVRVYRGGTFAMGTLNEGQGCDPTASSVVNGDVRAYRALTVKLDCTMVNGDLTSYKGGTGGWGPTCEESQTTQPLNFVVKDNVVSGDVGLARWRGCWMGLIRTQVGGDVVLYRNTTGSSDSMEVVTDVITDDLACYRNSPAPQVGDSGGAPNVVGGDQRGQCATL